MSSIENIEINLNNLIILIEKISTRIENLETKLNDYINKNSPNYSKPNYEMFNYTDHQYY
jgi:tetrahydromethanopterin S-methyltransferase subunit B